MDTNEKSLPSEDQADSTQVEPPSPDDQTNPAPEPRHLAREIGGRDGPEPTRYGDWEKAGRCIDF